MESVPQSRVFFKPASASRKVQIGEARMNAA